MMMLKVRVTGVNLRQLLSDEGERWNTEPYGEDSRCCNTYNHIHSNSITSRHYIFTSSAAQWHLKPNDDRYNLVTSTIRRVRQPYASVSPLIWHRVNVTTANTVYLSIPAIYFWYLNIFLVGFSPSIQNIYKYNIVQTKRIGVTNIRLSVASQSGCIGCVVQW